MRMKGKFLISILVSLLIANSLSGCLDTQNSNDLKISIDPVGSGNVKLDPEKLQYNKGEVVALNPVPEQGYYHIGNCHDHYNRDGHNH